MASEVNTRTSNDPQVKGKALADHAKANKEEPASEGSLTGPTEADVKESQARAKKYDGGVRVSPTSNR